MENENGIFELDCICSKWDENTGKFTFYTDIVKHYDCSLHEAKRGCIAAVAEIMRNIENLKASEKAPLYKIKVIVRNIVTGYSAVVKDVIIAYAGNEEKGIY